MRIGIDIRAIGKQRTGDETYTLQLIKNLMSEDIKNKYFLYTDTKNKKNLQRINNLLKITNNNFKIVSITPAYKLLWTMFFLARQAKRDSLDILHVQYITPLFLSKKIKLITTVHDISFARYSRFISKKDLLILKLFIPLSLKKADKIIAVSSFTKEEIIKVYKINGAKIKIIYNGGVAKDFQKKISEKQVLNFRKKYDIMKPYLLYLGTLQPRKNISFLIKAFIALKVKYKDKKEINELELAIRGEKKGHNYDQKIDSLLANIKQKHKDIYSKIKFIGYIPNEQAPLIFKGAKIFCFPSFYEGFGLPLLEAMSQGTPVIANNKSCFPEIIKEAGIIYELNNYEEWSNGILKLLENKEARQSIVTKGYKRVKDFSWNKNAQQTINLYEDTFNSHQYK
jgi:glycosyltransferase involved in cell wall biosynthesis